VAVIFLPAFLAAAPAQAAVQQAPRGPVIEDPKVFMEELERLVELSHKSSRACQEFQEQAEKLLTGQAGRNGVSLALTWLERYPGKPAAVQEIESRFLARPPRGVDAARVMAAFGRMETCRFGEFSRLASWVLKTAPAKAKSREWASRLVREAVWKELKGPGPLSPVLSSLELMQLSGGIRGATEELPRLLQRAHGAVDAIKKQLASAEADPDPNAAFLRLASDEIIWSEELRVRIRPALHRERKKGKH
jgi:hypothetical protein